MNKKTLTLLVSILVTVLLWITADLYHVYKETPLPPISSPELENINPNIDTLTIRALKKI